MTIFAYRAVSTSGDLVEGEMDATTRDDAVERLRGRGLLPIRVDPGKSPRRIAFPRLSGLRKPPIAIFTRELATLLEAGLTLDAALGMLANLANARSQQVLVQGLRDQIRGGASFADALRGTGDVFPSYYIGLVRAGEAGGSLDQVLRQLADLLEEEERVREQIRSALVYPIILLVMCTGTIAIFITVVLPQFEPLLVDSGADLPAMTRFLMGVDDAVADHGWLMLAGLLGLLVLIRISRTSEAMAAAGDRFRLALPLLGTLITKTETARLARMLGTLLRNGVPLLGALAIVRETISNRILREAIVRVEHALEAGGGLAEPLAMTGRFPPLATHLVSVGERSGRLDDMLTRLAAILEREVGETTKRLLTLLVPALTVGSAVIIASVIGSILSALLSVYDIPG